PPPPPPPPPPPFFFQAEDVIRDVAPSRGLGDVYKRQV
ncbi:PRC-barrel domain containing protein, partial [Streptococcus agalactiae]